MSSENIKKVYVLNLDNKRLSIISGVLIIGFGVSFMAGLKFRKNPASAPVINSADLGSAETPVISEGSVKSTDNHVLLLPEEDTRIFTENTEKTDDPFLDSPLAPEDNKPAKTGKSAVVKSTTPGIKNTVPSEKGVHESGFFTIQVGAFVHEKDANALVKHLKKKGVDARVDKGTLYYFVRAGKSNKKESLNPVYEKITNQMKLKAIIIQKKMT